MARGVECVWDVTHGPDQSEKPTGRLRVPWVRLAALAAALILINAIVSIALRLRMERSLFLASVRTTVQLLLVGFVLQWVFAVDQWYVVVAMLLVMTLVAGYTAAARNERRFAGMWISTLLSMGISSWIITA